MRCLRRHVRLGAALLLLYGHIVKSLVLGTSASDDSLESRPDETSLQRNHALAMVDQRRGDSFSSATRRLALPPKTLSPKTAVMASKTKPSRKKKAKHTTTILGKKRRDQRNRIRRKKKRARRRRRKRRRRGKKKRAVPNSGHSPPTTAPTTSVESIQPPVLIEEPLNGCAVSRLVATGRCLSPSCAPKWLSTIRRAFAENATSLDLFLVDCHEVIFNSDSIAIVVLTAAQLLAALENMLSKSKMFSLETEPSSTAGRRLSWRDWFDQLPPEIFQPLYCMSKPGARLFATTCNDTTAISYDLDQPPLEGMEEVETPSRVTFFQITKPSDTNTSAASWDVVTLVANSTLMVPPNATFRVATTIPFAFHGVDNYTSLAAGETDGRIPLYPDK